MKQSLEEFRYKKQKFPELDQEFKAGGLYGKIKLGNKHLFWKKGLYWYYVPFSKLTRIFRRIEAVNSKMCCGNVSFDIQKLVCCCDDTQLELLIGEGNEREAAQLFLDIKQQHPDLLYGKP